MPSSNADKDLPLRENTDRCRCGGCREYFNSTASFDKHRTGKYSARRCLTIDEMVKIGMSQNTSGYWISQKSTRTYDSIHK